MQTTPGLATAKVSQNISTQYISLPSLDQVKDHNPPWIILPPLERGDFEEMKAALDQGQLQEVVIQSWQNLNLFEKTTLDIAITGVSGSGKSSLVNALRGLDDDEINAAKTDVVQGTLHPESYSHPYLPNVTIWDLPGIGTEDFRAARYLKQVHWNRYDLFIIVSSTRFTENDANLAREIQKRRKKFYFVRSKIDTDLENECRKKDFREERTLEKIRNDCYIHLQQPRVFLISRWDLEKYDFPFLEMTIEQELDLMGKASLDIAITGVSGAGKSSLVNALRGLDDDDYKHNAAKTDVVQETSCPTRYSYPFLPNVTIWDLPGIGTGDFQAASYLKQVHFDQCDVFVIVSATRFTENDANLAREIQRRKKKFYFVRSKIDVDLGNEGRKRDFRVERTLEKVRNDCYQNLKQPRVFLVSRWDLDKYDFPLLQMTLEAELDDLKRRVFALAMPPVSKVLLGKKKKAMRKVIWMQALLSCALGAIPVPGLSFPCDIAILVGTLRHFCKVFGMEKASLGKAAQLVGKNEDFLRLAIKKTPMAGEITPEFVIHLLRKSLFYTAVMGLEFALDFVPGLGPMTGGSLSFLTTFFMLEDFLDDIVEDAENVLAQISEQV